MQNMYFLLEDFICGHISRKSGRVPDRLRQRMDKLRLQRKDRTGWARVCICISGKWKSFFFSFMSLLWWWFLLWQSICAVWLWKKCRKSVVSLWGLQPWLCCGWYWVVWFTGCSQPLWKLAWCKYIDMDNSGQVNVNGAQYWCLFIGEYYVPWQECINTVGRPFRRYAQDIAQIRFLIDTVQSAGADQSI